MVGSTVGTVVGGRYSTVRYFSRWPVLSPLLLLMRVTVLVRRAVQCEYRTVPYGGGVSLLSYLLLYVTRTLVSHSFRDKD